MPLKEGEGEHNTQTENPMTNRMVRRLGAQRKAFTSRAFEKLEKLRNVIVL